MPELPDVEAMRRYLDATSLHQQIEGIKAESCRVFRDVQIEVLRATLEGHALKSTRRHGKWLFAALDDGHWLVLHFGMTGDLKYFREMEEEPEYDRLLVRFSNGYHLAYKSQRKLGQVNLAEDVRSFIEKKDLGPDALSPDFGLEAFQEVLSGRRGMAKSTLMNQHIIAGIGNVYSDEILFHAGVHPGTPLDRLDARTLGKMFRVMKDVLQTAVKCQALPDRLPDSYIIPHRHGDGKCPRCGAGLERVKVSGRSAYYCPHCQGREQPTGGSDD